MLLERKGSSLQIVIIQHNGSLPETDLLRVKERGGQCRKKYHEDGGVIDLEIEVQFVSLALITNEPSVFQTGSAPSLDASGGRVQSLFNCFGSYRPKGS
jgi:hypothetical protein